MIDQQLETLLSKRETARLLGVSDRVVSDLRWRQRVGLRAIRVGALLKFAPRDVRDFVEHRREATA